MARLLLGLLLALAAATAPPAAAAEWLAGDLHVHSTYSHDSYGGPGDDDTGLEEAYTFGFPVAGDFALAAVRGLDYLAITDHNTVEAQADPGWGAHGVVGLPSYENSLSGHAQMHGATRMYAHGDPDDPAAVQALADALRADGGAFQVNHPANSETADPDDLDWRLGYAVRPDTVEAWNGPRPYQPPFPAANSHDDAIRYWEGWLDRGERVGLTGGSDSHWVSTSAAQGPGQPTTWVLAEDRTPAAILAALRAGRTTVSHQPPGLGGPRLFLEADRGRDGDFESAVGDTVPPRTRMRVRVLGAPGQELRVIGDGGRPALAPVRVTSAEFTHRFRAPRRRSWLRAELGLDDAGAIRAAQCPAAELDAYCRNRLLVTAMTSALYLRRRAR